MSQQEEQEQAHSNKPVDSDSPHKETEPMESNSSDPIQETLLQADKEGTPTTVDFDDLPEPMPELDEGPPPTPVDDIQEVLFDAARQGTSTDVDFEALPEPEITIQKKIIRFAKKTISTDPNYTTVSGKIGTSLTLDFWMLLALFVTFRLFTLLLLRPGGFIRDWSDFDTYMGIASLSDYSLYPFFDFWLEWPPIIPWLAVGVYKLSLLLPPWGDDPRLWFILILGTIFVLFEVGSFVLIHRMACRLFNKPALRNRVLWLYAGLFPPVYAMLGFFDGVALFFILLALDLLFKRRMFFSAVVVGVGFLVKIIPVLMLPVALRRLWYDHRKNNREAGIELGLYSVIFGLTVLVLLAPFLINGGQWLLASTRSMLGRSSWETIWAVLEGYYGFGVVTGDRLNPAEIDFAVHQSSLAWWIGWPVTFLLVGVYGYIFSRPNDYTKPRNMIAFSGLTITIFMLYSKGYSPQFLVYLLPFIILLFPNGRGLIYALIFTALNILEQPVYFVIMPDETWLLTFVVTARFIMVIILTLEFAKILLPIEKRFPYIITVRQYLPIALSILSALALVILLPLMGQAYAANHLANSPARRFIGFMKAQTQNVGVAGNCQDDGAVRLFVSDQNTYRELYPYLRNDIELVLTTGAPENSSFPPTIELLPSSGMAWILPTGTQENLLRRAANNKGKLVASFNFSGYGEASLYNFPSSSAPKPCIPLARFIGGIELLTHEVEVVSGAVNVTLYWRSSNTKLQNLTVFTQLLDINGQQIAGHDGIPLNGTAPTTGWTAGDVQIDPHRIFIPSGSTPPGEYKLIIGLYNDFGERLSSADPDGTNYPNRAVPLGTIRLP